MTIQHKTAEDLEAVLNNAASYFAKKGNNGKRLTTSQASKMSKILKKYIDDEEFDYDGIIADLNFSSEDSAIVHIICSKCYFINYDEEIEKIWYTLRILFGMETDHQHYDCYPQLLKLDWKVTNQDIKNMRQYMERQCPGLIKEGENEALLFIMAVGKRNKIKNLLTLLYDAFAKYRTAHRLKVVLKIKEGIEIGGNHHPLNVKHFCEHTCLQHLPQKVRTQIRTALNSYEHRLIPGFKFLQFSDLYDDECSVFIDYTLMVSKAIRDIIHNSQNNDYFPFQIDLVIIPRKIVKAKIVMYHISDSESDNDEDDDDDIKENTTGDDNGAKELYDTFERVFNVKYGQKYTKIEVDHRNDILVQNIVQYLKEYLVENGRVSIVIDRRTNPNTMYIYSIPDGKNVFPADFCLTTLVDMCASYVIPIWNENIRKAEKFPFVGGRYAPGKLFQVSYQMLNIDHKRFQWNFAGNGMRLTPDVMVNIWPMVFDNSQRIQSEQYISREMGICDPLFYQWSKQFGDIYTMTYQRKRPKFY